MTFDEACRRAGGRRAYNARRRMMRAARITAIIELQRRARPSGRALAARFGVHESTISRDLKFIEGVRACYRRGTGCEMRPESFRWLRRARGYETTFQMRDGVRVR